VPSPRIEARSSPVDVRHTVGLNVVYRQCVQQHYPIPADVAAVAVAAAVFLLFSPCLFAA